MKPRRASAADTERAEGRKPEGIRDDAGTTRPDALQVLRAKIAAVGREPTGRADASSGGSPDAVGEPCLFGSAAASEDAETDVAIGDDAASAPLFASSNDEAPAPVPATRKRRRPEPTPAQRALGLLVRREHSRKELKRKLAWRGVEASEAEAAVERMREAGWQDDARFAESLVRSRAASGHGPIRIRAELSTHGLSQELIAEAMDGFDGNWNELARDLVRRRHGRAIAEDRAVQRKAAELLVRRGFTYDQIRAATRLDPDEDETC